MRARTRFGTTLLVVAAIGVGLYGALPASALVGTAATSNCTITGTSGDDILRGTAGRDVICGRGGNDTIRGGGGKDILDGGPGDDRIWGGAGVDVITGGSGDDQLRGGPGTDAVDGGTGHDSVTDEGGRRVFLTVNYDLPKGSTVEWKYHPPSGNCLRGWNDGWTDHVGADEPRTHYLFWVRSDSVACSYEKSYGQWVAFVTTPSQQKNSGILPVSTETNAITGLSAEATCSFPAGLTCSGGSDYFPNFAPFNATPSVFIGPIY